MAAVIVSAPAMLVMTPSTKTSWVMTRATIRTTIPMVNEARASAIRRRRHRSMFDGLGELGVVLGKGLLDLVELALVILGERHDPFSSAPG